MHVYVLLVVSVICVLKVLGCDVPPPAICQCLNLLERCVLAGNHKGLDFPSITFE